MISVGNIGVSFSGIDLFKGISFIINERDRIGLVGKNGVGKSTLLKIILGKQGPDHGQVVIPEGRKIGYLPQELHFDGDGTIWSETLKAFQEVNALKKREAEIQKELETREDYESESYSQVIDELGQIHMRMNVMDDGKQEGNAEQVLLGLGFKREEFHRPMSEFSGGWQMRVELAKLILESPDLLLLDEPTNHLDIESIMWLERFFIDYPGAIMMISHDRMFLDNITNRTIEIVKGRIYDYKAPYSKYVQLREERIDQQKAAFDNQQKFINQQERFIERFKAKNTKAKQAQSKLKQLEKLDRIELDETDESSIRFRFPPASRAGDVVVRARGVGKRYGDKQVFSGVDLDIERGEHVAFVGQNGQGKSTLVKMIVEELEGEGELKIGHNVEIGYYAQVQEKSLDHEITVEKTIENEATGEMAKIHKIRGLLGAFLFGPNDYEKKVKVLSGGEKSRLALAKLLLKQCNLLILDEPTNHLDMSAKEVLKQALSQYNGTIIVVSHDRDFLQGLTDRTFEFRGGKVREHLGTIDDFLGQYDLASFRDFEASGTMVDAKASKPKDKPKSENKRSFEDKKQKEKELRDLKKQLNNLERKIESQEKAVAELEQKLADPEIYSTPQSKDLVFNHADANKKLEEYMARWEKIGEQTSELEKELT